VAIFDADFQPEPDFLHRTVPFLVHNPELALVQARWKFGNLTPLFSQPTQAFPLIPTFPIIIIIRVLRLNLIFTTIIRLVPNFRGVDGGEGNLILVLFFKPRSIIPCTSNELFLCHLL
jgi:hypothetical protein